MNYLVRHVSGSFREAAVHLWDADVRALLCPWETEIRDRAQTMQGDLHRAAVQLLNERQGSGGCSFEQQVIVAALHRLQDRQDSIEGSGRVVFGRD